MFFSRFPQISLFVSSSDAIQPGWLVNFLKNIDSKQIKEMQANLAKVCQPDSFITSLLA